MYNSIVKLANGQKGRKVREKKKEIMKLTQNIEELGRKYKGHKQKNSIENHHRGFTRFKFL